MKRENIDRAVALATELNRMEMCRDLISGGCDVVVFNADRAPFKMPTYDDKFRTDILAAIMWRIDDINKEIEEL